MRTFASSWISYLAVLPTLTLPGLSVEDEIAVGGRNVADFDLCPSYYNASRLLEEQASAGDKLLP